MPIYEYICAACDERFSVFKKTSSESADAKCPRCDSHEIKKVMSAFSCSPSSGGCSSSVPSRGFSGGG